MNKAPISQKIDELQEQLREVTEQIKDADAAEYERLGNVSFTPHYPSRI